MALKTLLLAGISGLALIGAAAAIAAPSSISPTQTPVGFSARGQNGENKFAQQQEEQDPRRDQRRQQRQEQRQERREERQEQRQERRDERRQEQREQRTTPQAPAAPAQRPSVQQQQDQRRDQRQEERRDERRQEQREQRTTPQAPAAPAQRPSVQQQQDQRRDQRQEERRDERRQEQREQRTAPQAPAGAPAQRPSVQQQQPPERQDQRRDQRPEERRDQRPEQREQRQDQRTAPQAPAGQPGARPGVQQQQPPERQDQRTAPQAPADAPSARPGVPPQSPEQRRDPRQESQDQRPDRRPDQRQEPRRDERQEQRGVLTPEPTPRDVRRVDQLREQRREIREGDRTVIREPGRTIVREGDRTIIRHDETERFRLRARDVRTERRGGETRTIFVRPDGSRVITVTDENGRLVRRLREDRQGREIVIIDNSRRRPGVEFSIGSVVVDIAPPRITMPRERYIVETRRADRRMIYETFIAPPVVEIERPYSLDEIRYTQNLRERMPRVDIDTITFDTGSWEIRPDQVRALEEIAYAIEEVLRRNPDEVFLIEGHTDAVGADIDNLSLSDRRAESVAVALTDQFSVPPENLVTQGYGEQYLKVPTDGPEERNRRVTVRRITPLLAGKR